MNKLPIMTKNQMTGNIAAQYLDSVMKKYCQFQPYDQSNDLGIDFIGTVLEEIEPKKFAPTSNSFYVQCKGTDDSSVKLLADGKTFSYSIKVSTINFWKQKKDPTFLCLVDIKDNKIYWRCAMSEIKNKDLSNQDTFTFHIPIENCIDVNSKKLPESFIFEILNYYTNFADYVIEQYDKVNDMMKTQESIDPYHMIALIDSLEQNYRRVKDIHEKTVTGLLNIIRYNFNRINFYCRQLNQMTEFMQLYCPEGIFEYSFDSKNGKMNYHECKERVSKLINSDEPSIKALLNLYFDIFTLRGNYLGFYRECVFEDSPRGDHKALEDEYNEYNQLFTFIQK